MQTLTAGERQYRGVTYLLHGQQFSGWLPKGEYAVLGECTLTDRDGTHHPMLQVQRVVKGQIDTWYVARSAIQP